MAINLAIEMPRNALLLDQTLYVSHQRCKDLHHPGHTYSCHGQIWPKMQCNILTYTQFLENQVVGQFALQRKGLFQI